MLTGMAETVERGLLKFASPNLRIGLLLDDHPGSTHRFADMKGAELGALLDDEGFADRFADKAFVVCMLDIPGHDTAIGWKTLDKKAGEDPETYVSVQTKALGRALKRAGYPDNMDELRALILWRQRNAALRGEPIAALAPGGEPAKELDSAFDAASTDEDGDDDDVMDVDSDEVEIDGPPIAPPKGKPVNVKIVDTTGVSDPTDNLDVMLAADDTVRAKYEEASKACQDGLRTWMRERGGKVSRTATLAWLRHLVEIEAKNAPPEARNEEAERVALGDALREKLRDWEQNDTARFDDAMAKLVAAEIWVDEADLSVEDIDRATRILFHDEEPVKG